MCAHIAQELGRGQGAPSVEPFVEALKTGGGLGFALASVHELAWTLTPLGRGEELADALDRFGGNPWARAGRAFALGDPVGAADVLGAIGALSSEAYCRLAAARSMVEEGRRAEADAQLVAALGFFRSVGATRYVRVGESLLAASAQLP